MRRLIVRPLPPVLFASPARHTSSTSQVSTINAADKRQGPQADDSTIKRPPYYLESGCGLFAKRPSRPFPPPFLSPPSQSFSDPLSTHHRSRDRRPSVNGQPIRGLTNGDDAVLMAENFIGTNDGVGQWSTRPNGHAGLWSRLILHFWAIEAERDTAFVEGRSEPRPVDYLQRAFEETVAATSSPNDWSGTTTACAALLHSSDSTPQRPSLYVTNLGDSQVLVLRPHDREVLYKTSEQWHWFDCPRQLGTNSPDTPKQNAVMDVVEIQEGDVVLAMSDGVIDNLWEHEVVKNVLDSLEAWDPKEKSGDSSVAKMDFVARKLVKAARVIAEDPFAESPFMERAVDEGLAMEGGKNASSYSSRANFLTEIQASSTTSVSSPPYVDDGIRDSLPNLSTQQQAIADRFHLLK
ncbi:MAG: hypothetical protein M1825_002910 [Sarcosagium campestre]|nr:MAG: hypothetical protein M1825_002910 [Sarcosagium campestre]